MPLIFELVIVQLYPNLCVYYFNVIVLSKEKIVGKHYTFIDHIKVPYIHYGWENEYSVVVP